MFSSKLIKLLGGLLVSALMTACAGARVPPALVETPYPGAVPGAPGEVPPSGGIEIPTPPSPGTIVTSPAYPMPEQPSAETWRPQPGDERLKRADVTITEKQILSLESFPPQIRLILKGTLPTPCHQLRVRVSQPDERLNIHMEVYSLYDPTQFCTQVIEPFAVQIPLDNLPSGKYTVLVNGEKLGEIIR